MGWILTSGGAGAESVCVSQPTESKAFATTADIVRRLPEVKTWSSSHSFPVAFDSRAKPVVRDGRCYTPVAVYASRPERLELWHLFYVHAQSHTVLVQDRITGDVVSLKEWRSKS